MDKVCDEKSRFRQHFLFAISYFFSTPSPPQSLAAFSPFQGACEWLREFIRRFERRTPLARLFAWPSPPRGRAVRYEAVFGDLGACVNSLRWFIKGRAIFRIIKFRINFRICYLRWIKFQLKKVNFVNISYLLFSISFSTPSPPQSLAALSPFQGACGWTTGVYSKIRKKNPPRHSANGTLPQGGVRKFATLVYQGACDIPYNKITD